MVALVGRQGISGDGAYWTVTQAGDLDVLTMVFPEQVATDAAVPDVSLPEVVGQEAWTLDFDAVRAHMHPETSSHFPVWARCPLQDAPFSGSKLAGGATHRSAAERATEVLDTKSTRSTHSTRFGHTRIWHLCYNTVMGRAGHLIPPPRNGGPAFFLAVIHPSAWKSNSPNYFAFQVTDRMYYGPS